MHSYLLSRCVLLLFDNFEHVSDGAHILDEILRAAARFKAIVTSRSRLNLTGKTVMTLTGLNTRWDTPAHASETEALRLFLDGARRNKPGFEFRDDDLTSLAEILTLTEGLPLAILLAAAWVDVLSVSEIAAEVTRSLDFLETDLGDVPDRHRSIRAVFEHT